MGKREVVGIKFPRDIEKAILSLPLLDLLALDRPERVLNLRIYSRRLKRILETNPFFRILPFNRPFPRYAKVVDLGKIGNRQGYRQGLPFWKQALLSVKRLVRVEAINYFLSGPFPRQSIWFGPEEYDYISLISELTDGRYVVLAIDVRRISSYQSSWSIYHWIELVHCIISRGDLFVLVSTNDDGRLAETISGLYRSRSMSISYRSYYKYVVALMSKARVVVGNDLEQIFLGAYLRDGTIGLVSGGKQIDEVALWEEENYVFPESIPPSVVAEKIYSLASKMEAKLTREERGLWSQR